MIVAKAAPSKGSDGDALRGERHHAVGPAVPRELGPTQGRARMDEGYVGLERDHLERGCKMIWRRRW